MVLAALKVCCTLLVCWITYRVISMAKVLAGPAETAIRLRHVACQLMKTHSRKYVYKHATSSIVNLDTSV